MIIRPTWDTYFLRIAEAVASRATCPRARCGAVLVIENRIVSTGYNGAPPGHPHCGDEGCLIEDDHCQRAIHAEVNAVVFARRDLRGATMYVYKQNTGGSIGYEACRECRKVMAAAGVDAVYWLQDGAYVRREML